MSFKQRNIKLSGLSKSLSRTKLNKNSTNVSIYQQPLTDHHRAKSLYLKTRNNNQSCFLPKNWNRISNQSAPQNSYLSQTSKISPDKINQTLLINRFRALQQASPLMTINPLKQKILVEEVKRSMQYKSMEVSKLLADLHHFFLSVQEVRWILQTSHHLMVEYNFKISSFYQQYFKVYTRKDQIQSLIKETQQLIKRFNQLGSIDIHKDKFNIFNRKNFELSNSRLGQFQNIFKGDALIINETNQKTGKASKKSEDQQKQSIYRFLQNLKRQNSFQHDNLKQDFKTKTFNITQKNSPFKNKTLNQLIKLSQMRRTSQSKSNCQVQDQKENFNQLNYIQKNKVDPKQATFNKGKKIFLNEFIKVQQSHSQNNNPFQAISIQIPENRMANQKKIRQYQLLIEGLKQQISELKNKLDNQNYNRKALQTLQQLKEELYCENKNILQQNQAIKNQYLNYQVYTKRIVQRAINLLGKISDQNRHNSQTKTLNFYERQSPQSTSRASLRLSQYYYNQILKLMTIIAGLSQNVKQIDCSLSFKDQQPMKDKKYILQRELIQIQFQISQLRTVKDELNVWIQQREQMISADSQKNANLTQQSALRMIFVQAKTLQQILEQQ